ncbi:MAG: hypothetical protein ACFBSG_08785 [Leptolyngbyaceae cyanobacterium]
MRQISLNNSPNVIEIDFIVVNVLIATVKYTRQQFEASPRSASPFLQTILREGIAA